MYLCVFLYETTVHVTELSADLHLQRVISAKIRTRLVKTQTLIYEDSNAYKIYFFLSEIYLLKILFEYFLIIMTLLFENTQENNNITKQLI